MASTATIRDILWTVARARQANWLKPHVNFSDRNHSTTLYKGMAPAMNDLLSGEIAIGFVNITAQVAALHRSGKIRILAINAPARLAAVPDIPTAAEAGLANFVSQTFFGVFAAAGTPKAALDKINEVTQAKWSDSEFQKRLTDSGFEPMLGLGPDQAARYLNDEIARWGPLVQASGVQTQQ